MSARTRNTAFAGAHVNKTRVPRAHVKGTEEDA